MEELKLIMQTLMGLGETAKEGFIWWLVIDKLIPCLLWGAFAGGLIALGFFIVRKIADSAQAEADAKKEQEGALKSIKVIRGLLDIYSFPGMRQDSQYLYDADFKATEEGVRNLREAFIRQGVKQEYAKASEQQSSQS